MASPRKSYPNLNLSPIAKGRRQRAGLYELIQEQLAPDPDGPLDASQLPSVELGKTGLEWAPGALDGLLAKAEIDLGQEEVDPSWKAAIQAIEAIENGDLDDWRILERNLSQGRVISAVDEFFEHFEIERFGLPAKALFWEMALKSANYEAVKWGIAVGGIELDDDQIGDLLTFARHPELTVFAAAGLVREVERRPEIVPALVDLLPVSRQWGIVRLIDMITQEPTLVDDPTVQHALLIYGMENHDGLVGEVTLSLAETLNFHIFFGLAEKDDRVYEAIIQFFEVLLLEEEWAAISLVEVARGPEYLRMALDLLEARPADVLGLSFLASANEFLSEQHDGWPNSEAMYVRCRRLWKTKHDPDLIRKELQCPRSRGKALELILRMELRELLPDVAEVFKRRLDSDSIRVLADLGELEHIQLLLDELPRVVDFESRPKRLRRSNALSEAFAGSFEYASIVECLGRLGTEQAVNILKRAACDFEPLVRTAALKAMADLEPELVDKELKRILRLRVKDSPRFVSEAAREAAAILGVKITTPPKE